MSVRQLVRRVRYGDPVIIVSGLPRSGTSMAMKMLDAAGTELTIDGIRTADEDNPKGYFEFEKVKELDKKGADKSWLRASRGKGVKIISYLLLHLPEDNNYKVIFVQRDLREVMASQKKMLDHRGEENPTEDERMIELFEDHLRRVRGFIKRRPWIDVLWVPHRDVLEKPREQAERIAEFLGYPAEKVDAMAGVVDKKLYRNRAGQG